MVAINIAHETARNLSPHTVFTSGEGSIDLLVRIAKNSGGEETPRPERGSLLENELQRELQRSRIRLYVRDPPETATGFVDFIC